ncbi:MAG: YbaB/EbfC family nucleoid-associated protein [Acidobacteriota bacterium]
MPNLNKLLKQAQRMQEKVQEEMEALQVQESAGGGMVSVLMNGHKQVLEIRVDPSLLVPQEKEMLEDLLVAAVNAAGSKVDETLQTKLGGLGGGLGLPGF